MSTTSTDSVTISSTTADETTQSTTNTTQNFTTTPFTPSSSTETSSLDITTTTVLDTTTHQNTSSYIYTEDTSGDQDGMSVGVIIAVVMGICVALLIVVLSIVLYRKRRKRPPKQPATLPSASDVDKTIHKLKAHDIPETADQENMQVYTESPYGNLDADGNPTDKTNPNVGDDGYLQKEMKKKKKKRKNKFHRKKAKTHQNSEIDLDIQNIESGSKRTVSDASYSHGRSPDFGDGAYDTGKVKDESFYVNSSDNNKGYANLQGIHGDKDGTGVNYYNMQDNKGPIDIYENP